MKHDPNKICVLLVEDDEAIRETMKMSLELENLEVHAAANGQEALEMISASKTLPDLVITDLMMPYVSGFELVDILRKLDRTYNIPIIVYSAIANLALNNEVFSGCYSIQKPMSLETLHNTIKQALTHPVNPDTVILKAPVKASSTTTITISHG